MKLLDYTITLHCVRREENPFEDWSYEVESNGTYIGSGGGFRNSSNALASAMLNRIDVEAPLSRELEE